MKSFGIETIIGIAFFVSIIFGLCLMSGTIKHHEPATREQVIDKGNDFAYWKDKRTNLCFISDWYISRSTMTNVPCTQEVETMIAIQNKMAW